MITTRILKLTAGLMIFGMIGCEANREVETEREIFTEPATETREVEVLTEDTFMIERTTEVSVDTTRVDGDEVRETTTTTP